MEKLGCHTRKTKAGCFTWRGENQLHRWHQRAAVLTVETAGVYTGSEAKHESTTLSCCEKANTVLGCKQKCRQQNTCCNLFVPLSVLRFRLQYLNGGLELCPGRGRAAVIPRAVLLGWQEQNCSPAASWLGCRVIPTETELFFSRKAG